MPLNAEGQFVLSRAYSSIDIRGEVGTLVQPIDATRLGRAVAYWLEREKQPKRVVVSGDYRLTTTELKNALIDGLISAGVHVLDIGIAPTPAMYGARKHWGVPVGIQVTASHNPPQDNGFKIQLGNLPNTEAEFQELWGLIAQGASGAGHGTVERVEYLEQYAALLKGAFAQGGKGRVVIDSGNGCCGVIAPQLFRDLGYEVVEVFSEPDGRYPNRNPDPLKAGVLTELSSRVRAENAMLGIAYDGDGDRAAFVDNLGRPLGSDLAFVLFIRDQLPKAQAATVIYDIKCSDIVANAVKALGGVAHMEKTGHAYIKRSFAMHDAQLAGELTGHFAFRDWFTDDGIYASLVMTRIAQESAQPLSEVVDAIPRNSITEDVRLKMSDADIQRTLAQIREHFAPTCQIITLDGVRVQFADGWGLARQSITSPELTLRFEGYTPDALRRIVSAFADTSPLLSPALHALEI
jgi:phosphomannomutase / phosphoglucomutase